MEREKALPNKVMLIGTVHAVARLQYDIHACTVPCLSFMGTSKNTPAQDNPPYIVHLFGKVGGRGEGKGRSAQYRLTWPTALPSIGAVTLLE